MVLRPIVKDDSQLQSSSIIKMPNGTVFRFNEAEGQRIEELWGSAYDAEPESSDISAIEGKLHLRAHIRRERSPFLVKKKLEEFRRLHGSLHCETCNLEEGQYPATLAASVFEVHHISPLSIAATPRRTTLAELAVMCASCHRAVHATADVENNMKVIKRLWAK